MTIERRTDVGKDTARLSPGEPEFPSARYFQVHFEYVEYLLADAKQALEALQQQVAEAQRVMTALADNDGCLPTEPEQNFAAIAPLEDCTLLVALGTNTGLERPRQHEPTPTTGWPRIDLRVKG